MKNFKILPLLFFIVLLAYGQTLRMYFWIDDNALIYKLQHVNEALGFWGPGATGAGPYRHIVDQFVPFYPFFKTTPVPYYVVGLILYFLASITVYYFTKSLCKSKKTATITSLIFASGYVASETMFGIVNSWQTSRGIIMALITFLFYLKFLQEKQTRRKIIFYISSVILFYLCLDTVYIRAHGLIFALIFFDILFSPVKFKIKSILGSIARLTPFAISHYLIYLKGSVAYVKGFAIFNLFNTIFSDKKYEMSTIPLQDIGNIFIPDKITSYFDRFISRLIQLPVELSVGSIFAGLVFIIISLMLLIKFWKKDNFNMRVLLFSLGWIIANFIVFYFREPYHTLWTTHRYFSYSFIGISLFWVISSQELAKTKKIFAYLPFLVIVIFLWLGFNKQYEFNKSRSIPAKDFFAKFNEAVPKLKKGDVLYFNISNDNVTAGQFGSFFGGMFSEASNFAIFTPGIDYAHDFLFTYSFDDVIKLLDRKELMPENLYSFYYGDHGLIDISNQIRLALSKPQSTLISDIKINESSVELTPPSNTASYVPSNLSISMKVDLKSFEDLDFKKNKLKISENEREKVFAYLESKNFYLNNVKVSSASFWKEQIPDFAVDGRLDTSWRGSRGYWEEYDKGREPQKEYLQVDLGRVEIVGGLRFVTSQRPLVPSKYQILASIDGKKWNLVKEVERNEDIAEGTEIFDIFNGIQARFLKMEISKTIGNDGPEIKEFEVVEKEFVNLKDETIQNVEDHPFDGIETVDEYNKAVKYVRENAKIKLFWKSDADHKWGEANYYELPIFVDGKIHTYQIPLPASGLSWQGFNIAGFNFPAKIEVEKAEMVSRPI